MSIYSIESYNACIMVIKRILFDILLFLSIFILPWWVMVIIVFIGIFIFKNFYEFIFAFIAMYSLYIIPNSRLTPFWFSLAISVIYISIQSFRHYIILYNHDISY